MEDFSLKICIDVCCLCTHCTVLRFAIVTGQIFVIKRFPWKSTNAQKIANADIETVRPIIAYNRGKSTNIESLQTKILPSESIVSYSSDLFSSTVVLCAQVVCKMYTRSGGRIAGSYYTDRIRPLYSKLIDCRRVLTVLRNAIAMQRNRLCRIKAGYRFIHMCVV